MYRVVFTSRASRHLSRKDIASLREHAGIANEREGLTGLFLFDGKRFLLALEGPEVSLLTVMHKIYADDRHCDLVFILSESAEDRQFPHWAMSRGITHDSNCDFVEAVKREVFGVKNPAVKASFIGFASLARSKRDWL